MEMHNEEWKLKHAYLQRFEEDKKHGPRTERHVVRRVRPLLKCVAPRPRVHLIHADHPGLPRARRAIMADQADPRRLELGRYDRYLTAEVLWELAVAADAAARAASQARNRAAAGSLTSVPAEVPHAGEPPSSADYRGDELLAARRAWADRKRAEKKAAATMHGLKRAGEMLGSAPAAALSSGPRVKTASVIDAARSSLATDGPGSSGGLPGARGGGVEAIDLSGWRSMTLVKLRALLLPLGAGLREMDWSDTPVTPDMVHALGVRFERLMRLNCSRCVALTDGSMAGIINGARHSITSLNLSGCAEITHEALRWLAGVVGFPPRPAKYLRSLNVAGCSGIRDAGLHALGLASTRLRSAAELAASPAGRAARRAAARKLKARGGPQLEDLTDGSGGAGGGGGAGHEAGGSAGAGKRLGCPKLKFINLSDCGQITDAGLSALAAGCPELRVLNLARLDLLTDAGVVSLAGFCRDLRSLSLRKLQSLSDVSLNAIGEGCPQLQALDIAGCYKVTEAGVFHVAHGCKGLQYLNMDGCENVTEKGLRELVYGMPFAVQAESYFGLKPLPQVEAAKLGAQADLLRAEKAVLIQGGVRALLERRRRQRAAEEATVVAARATLQRVGRGMLDRRRTRVMWQLRAQWRRVVYVQACARRMMARIKFRRAQKHEARVRAGLRSLDKLRAAFKSRRLRRMAPEGAAAVRRLRAQRVTLGETVAAVRLQAVGAGTVSRSRFRAIAEEKAQLNRDRRWAAMTAQRRWRGVRGRRVAAAWAAYVHARTLERIAAALLVQRVYRGFLGRKHFRWFKENRDRILWERRCAAVDMQRAARGMLARLELARRQREWNRINHAATQLQKIARRRITPTFHEFKIRHVAEANRLRTLRQESHARDRAHERWRLHQEELARESASVDDSDDDWQEIVDDATGAVYWWSPSRAERRDEWVDDWQFEHSMINRRVQIYWNEEERWYEGYFAKYNKKRNLFKVVYDDGDTDWVNCKDDPARVQVWDTDVGAWVMWRHIPKPKPRSATVSPTTTRPTTAAVSTAPGAAAAAGAGEPPLPAGWAEYVDDATGAPYWVDDAGTATWFRPTAPAVAAGVSADAAGGTAPAAAWAAPAGVEDSGGALADDWAGWDDAVADEFGADAAADAADAAAAAVDDDDDGPTRVIGDWEELWDGGAGAHYYYHTVTGETQWDAPPEFQ